MKITVIGCGRWGSFIAWYLDKIGHGVTLYGRENSKHMTAFLQTRTNGLVQLSENVKLSTDLEKSIKISEVVIISISSQGLRDLLANINRELIKNKTIVLCMKGIEVTTGKRLTEIVDEYFANDVKSAIWVGPGHVQEFTHNNPNCMVIDSNDDEVTSKLVDEFSSELIRFYYGNDLIGNEIGAAAKNVIGIAAGFLDGLDRTSLKGALMSRGTREIARLIKAMGGNELSAYGLAHLGDYEATVFSKFSHNRQFGESFVKNEPYTDLAEGVYTVKALLKLSKQNDVELPICEAVYKVIYENQDAPDVLSDLFLRSLKNEVY